MNNDGFNILMDTVKHGAGTTNDGTTAKGFF